MKPLFHFSNLWKNACLIPGILFLISCTSEHSKPIEIVQNYGTGEVSRRYQEINHKKEGMMTDYYPDGKLMGERMFENDLQVGRTILYYQDGKIKEVQYYEDGKINGGDTVFYETGKPQFLLTLNKGIKDGYVRKWNEDGNLTFEAKYALGKLVEVKGKVLEPDSIPHQELNSPADMR